MKYLIVGLGNIGEKYNKTRHNIGFEILDALANASNIFFEDKRHAFRTDLKYKGRIFVLIKPTTYVNLSGKAVNYWLKKEKIPDDKLLVISDDLSLPFGKLRLRGKGGAAGHNGLTDIIETLGHSNFARLRFGIGSEFNTGGQVDYVLGQWTDEEEKQIDQFIKTSHEIIKSFGSIGIERTMSLYNK